jgi:hypothetical protein
VSTAVWLQGIVFIYLEARWHKAFAQGSGIAIAFLKWVAAESGTYITSDLILITVLSTNSIHDALFRVCLPVKRALFLIRDRGGQGKLIFDR